MMMMKNDKLELYTKEELENAFIRFINSIKYKSVMPSDKPIGYVLGGLAGSGKSNFSKTLDNTILAIADDLRLKHPRFKELTKEYGNDWIFKSNKFATNLLTKIISQTIKDRKNILIEGTFRTFEAPYNSLKKFKSHEYETHVHIILCQKDIAKASTIYRYYNMKKAGLEGREVRKDKFQEMLDNLANNSDKIKNSGLVDSFTMSARRDLNKFVSIYDSKINKEKPSELITKELNRVLTVKEQEFIQSISKYHENEKFKNGLKIINEGKNNELDR